MADKLTEKAPSLKELLKQRDDLEATINLIRTTEKNKAIDTIFGMIQDYQITQDELFPKAVKSKSIGKSAGSKLPAKYYDPSSGSTWTGKGRAPSWLAGKNRDEFLIKPSADSPFKQ